VCLNLGSNLAEAMFVRNRGRDVVGCSFQFSHLDIEGTEAALLAPA
jgi:hypothetical protein